MFLGRRFPGLSQIDMSWSICLRESLILTGTPNNYKPAGSIPHLEGGHAAFVSQFCDSMKGRGDLLSLCNKSVTMEMLGVPGSHKPADLRLRQPYWRLFPFNEGSSPSEQPWAGKINAVNSPGPQEVHSLFVPSTTAEPAKAQIGIPKPGTKK